jgi:hypothetical protein
MGEIPKSHSTSQLVLKPLLNEKNLTKMKILKSIVLVCLFVAGIINLQSCGENYEKVAYKLVKFDKELKLHTYLDEPFTGIGVKTSRYGPKHYYYEKGIFKKRVQGISHNGDGNIDVITQIGYRDFSEAKVGDLIWEGFYKNGGMIEERHIIQEILSKEGNRLNIIKKEISYDKEGNETSTKTKEDSL